MSMKYYISPPTGRLLKFLVKGVYGYEGRRIKRFLRLMNKVHPGVVLYTFLRWFAKVYKPQSPTAIFTKNSENTTDPKPRNTNTNDFHGEQ